MNIQNLFQKKLLPIALLLLATSNLFAQKVVHYDLVVTDTIVNFSGKEKRAIAVNGQIPMPTLTFTEGDTAEMGIGTPSFKGEGKNFSFFLSLMLIIAG